MRKKFFIPANFAESGEWRGHSWRNVAEAIVLSLINIAFWVILPLGIKTTVYITIFSTIGVGALGLFGINGMSITEFIGVYRKFKKNAKVLKAPTSKDKIEREKLLLEKKQKKQKLLEQEKKQLEKQQRLQKTVNRRRKANEDEE